MDGHNQKLLPDSVMQELFPEDNELDEESVFVAKCKKMSAWGIGAERVIILSTHCIYLLSSKELRQKMEIKKLDFYIKSVTSKEFILYDNTGKDNRLSFDERDQFLDFLRMRYAALEKKRTLKVYGINNDSLKAFRTQVSPGFDNTPDDKYRLEKEEIQCAADLKAKKAGGGVLPKAKVLEQNEFDFDFE